MRSLPRFGAVTFVLVFLTLLAFLSKLLAPLIVLQANPRLVNERPSSFASAAYERVPWYPLSTTPFSEARRRDRPILLVIAQPWSYLCRQYDSQIFSVPVVAKLLTQEFVCVRVDGVESPDWAAAYLPYSRFADAVSPDFQMWILDSSGRMFRSLLPPGMTQAPTEQQFELVVANTVHDYSVARQKDDFQLAPTAQAVDVAQLSGENTALIPNFGAVSAALHEASVSGGYPAAGMQRLWPSTWEYGLATRGFQSMETALDPLLKSPCRDLLDGGFFVSSTTPDWMHPTYDKPAVLNAEMCLLLARLGVSPGGRVYRDIAVATFDSLMGEFLDVDSLIRPCRIGDQVGAMGRSRRSSFSPRELRRLFSETSDGPGRQALNYFLGPDLKWLADNLGLRPGTNPDMTPFVTDLSLPYTDRYKMVLDRLRTAGPDPGFDGEVTLASCATAAARLLEAARILGDQGRIEKVLELEARLQGYQVGGVVQHELQPGPRAVATLDDYLAYSDLELQVFLTLGRIDSLRIGSRVLGRALQLFAAPGRGGLLTAAMDEVHSAAPDSDVIQVGDDAGESQTARLIRLGWAYGSLLSRAKEPANQILSKRFLAASSAAMAQFAEIAPQLGSYAGGYATDSALATDDTIVVCSGPDPTAMVEKVIGRQPLRIIAPVSGPVCPELMSRPGFYLLRRGQLVGPLGFAEACAKLPPTLAVG